MTHNEMLHFRELLLARRKEVQERVRLLEDRRQDMNERAIEPEEEAQKLSITEPYDRLDREGKEEIEKIDLALRKMHVGEYGICEACGDDISPKRLEALSWARLCVDCAREYERKNKKLPHPSELFSAEDMEPAADVPEHPGIPDEYQGLSNDQILAQIWDSIETDGRIDTDELEISLKDGVLHLEGTIAGEPEHQILLQLVTDVLGFSSVVDHLAVNEVVWEREDRTPGNQPPKTTLEDRLFYDQEDLTEDLFDAGDEKPYSPPERPLPHEESEPIGQ